MTPRIPPKNGSEFNPGNIIRLEFPAQGYVNPGKTTLEFDVEMIYPALDSEFSYVRFQNNIQSIFNRVRLLYGATPIEDIPYYNVIIRGLTEWTSTGKGMDQTSIAEGIGGIANYGNVISSGAPLTSPTNIVGNVRQKYIQGIDFTQPGAFNFSAATPSVVTHSGSLGVYGAKVPNAAKQVGGSALNTLITPAVGCDSRLHEITTTGNPVRRYQVQLMLGVFQQEKLIPTKFMASQLSIELTLENAKDCMYYQPSVTWTTQPNATTTLGTPSATLPSYKVSNVNLIPEILEFDASYDETFLMGLKSGGVPIKFSTWNNYRFSQNGVSSLNLQIQERSRSVKAIFCMQRRDPSDWSADSGASFFDTNVSTIDGASTLQEFQFRIGGRYFPAQPVQCSTEVGSSYTNGAAEAFIELQKAINTLGDSRLSTPVDTNRWGLPAFSTTGTVGSTHTLLNEYDYDYGIAGFKYSGAPYACAFTYAGLASGGYTSGQEGTNRTGSWGSSCFAMAIDLETSNGLEISGLNAEEQSDISLIARYAKTQAPGFVFDVFTYIDSMIVLRENNVLELIQ